MVGPENPYQPPADLEEPKEKAIDDSDALDLRSIAMSLSLVVVFAAAVVAFHSVSVGLGVVVITLVVMFIIVLAAFTVSKLIELFQRF